LPLAPAAALRYRRGQAQGGFAALVAALRQGFQPLDVPGLGSRTTRPVPWRPKPDHVFLFFSKSAELSAVGGVHSAHAS
jgi:hypothetical protein